MAVWSESVEKILRRRFPQLDVHVRPSFGNNGAWTALGYRYEHDFMHLALYSSADKNTFINEASKKLLRDCYPYREFPVH